MVILQMKIYAVAIMCLEIIVLKTLSKEGNMLLILILIKEISGKVTSSLVVFLYTVDDILKNFYKRYFKEFFLFAYKIEIFPKICRKFTETTLRKSTNYCCH